MRISEAIKKGKNLIGSTEINQLSLEILLAFILDKSREYLFSHEKDVISENQFDEYKVLLKRHIRGEPIAHLTGIKEFYGIKLFVDKNVLIPRPETESLVDEILKLISIDKSLKRGKVKILDIGTGSGNIAIALAKNLLSCDITAVDISKESLIIAEKNIKFHDLEEKIKLIHSDLLNSIENEEFDIIVANLPYIGTEKNNFVSKETKEFEPAVALFGGIDGLELYEKLFNQINEFGSCKYYLLGEIGFLQREKLEELFKKYFPNKKYKVKQDLAGLDRYFNVNFN